MTYLLKYPIPALMLLAVLAFSANRLHPASEAKTVVGDTKPLGDGIVRSWVQLNDAGEPVALGVTLTEAALVNLPHHGDHMVNETLLALPEQAGVAPFDHISIDWSPAGHEPPGLYDVPHFDIHFYMMTPAERNAMTEADPDYAAKLAKAPEGRYIPAGYVATPGGVPRMGAHWVDPTSPEFSGQGFTRTFIYGFYDGQMHFFEPMITKAFIERKESASFPVAQPEAFARPGFYPTQYSIRYDAEKKEYAIALEGLMRHF